jgi:hypothetical protein
MGNYRLRKELVKFYNSVAIHSDYSWLRMPNYFVTYRRLGIPAERLKVTQLVKKFPIFYVTRMFITAFRRARK